MSLTNPGGTRLTGPVTIKAPGLNTAKTLFTVDSSGTAQFTGNIEQGTGGLTTSWTVVAEICGNTPLTAATFPKGTHLIESMTWVGLSAFGSTAGTKIQVGDGNNDGQYVAGFPGPTTITTAASQQALSPWMASAGAASGYAVWSAVSGPSDLVTRVSGSGAGHGMLLIKGTQLS